MLNSFVIFIVTDIHQANNHRRVCQYRKSLWKTILEYGKTCRLDQHQYEIDPNRLFKTYLNISGWFYFWKKSRPTVGKQGELTISRIGQTFISNRVMLTWSSDRRNVDKHHHEVAIGATLDFIYIWRYPCELTKCNSFCLFDVPYLFGTFISILYIVIHWYIYIYTFTWHAPPYSIYNNPFQAWSQQRPPHFFRMFQGGKNFYQPHHWGYESARPVCLGSFWLVRNEKMIRIGGWWWLILP